MILAPPLGHSVFRVMYIVSLRPHTELCTLAKKLRVLDFRLAIFIKVRFVKYVTIGHLNITYGSLHLQSLLLL